MKYFYDALGRRVAKRFGAIDETDHRRCDLKRGIHHHRERLYSQSYAYLVDQDKILMAKATDGALSLYLDGRGVDEHLGEISERSGALGYAADHLGSVLNSGAAGEKKLIAAFGERVGDDDNSSPCFAESAKPVVYGFAGRQLDSESGLYYLRARMYEPGLGRFLTRDPLWTRFVTNTYAYAFNSPQIYIDPSGNCPIALIGPTLAFEAGFDVTTFIIALSNGQSVYQAGQSVIASSPLRNLVAVGSGIVFPEPVAGPIQVFSNPDTMNAILQTQLRQQNLDGQIGQAAGGEFDADPIKAAVNETQSTVQQGVSEAENYSSGDGN